MENVEYTSDKNLLDSNRLEFTITNNELADNIVFGIALFIASYFIKDILARVVHMRPRTWITGREDSNTLSYFAQARTAIQDNYWRRVWRRSGIDVAPAQEGVYDGEQNIEQYSLVLFIVFLGFLYEIASIYIGLPANRTIAENRTNLMYWRSASLVNARLVSNPGDLSCFSSPVLDGANIKSTALWVRCSTLRGFLDPTKGNLTALISENYPLILGRPEINRQGLGFTLGGQVGVFQRDYKTKLLLGGAFAGDFEFVGSTSKLVNDFLVNARLLYNLTGISIRKTGETSQSVIFSVNVTNLRWPKGIQRIERNRQTIVSLLIDFMMQGVFEYTGQGSRLLNVELNQSTGQDELIPLTGTAPVASYTGTVLPAFGAIILDIALLVIYAISMACLRSPPGLSWEVITAHGRKSAEKLLTGPSKVIPLVRCRKVSNPANCYIGYGVPPGYEQVNQGNLFTNYDVVEAAPLQ